MPRVHALWLLPLLASVSGCGGSAKSVESSGDDWMDLDVGGADHPLAGYRGHFLLTWKGARVGEAIEELTPSQDAAGLRFVRREHLRVTREGVTSDSELEVAIDTDASLRAYRVEVRQRAAASRIEGLAERDQSGDWRVSFAGEPERTIPGEAVPMELVPLLVASDGSGQISGRRFSGLVMMPGYGFGTGKLTVTAASSSRARAVLSTDAGLLVGELELVKDGTIARVAGADGSGARRVSALAAQQPFAPPELVTSASLPVAGARGAPQHLRLQDIQRPLPPPLPGQRVTAAANGDWHVELGRGDAFTPAAPADAASMADVVALVRYTAEVIEDDLSISAPSPRAAVLMGRGDCTTHALAFAAFAQEQGLAVRLVTGFRLDERGVLVRHRWAIVAVDGRWVAVDPTFGEAPAAARLLGLAVHAAAPAELGIAGDLAYAGLDRTRARAD